MISHPSQFLLFFQHKFQEGVAYFSSYLRQGGMSIEFSSSGHSGITDKNCTLCLVSTGSLPSLPQTLVKKLQSSKDSKKRAAAAAALAYDDRDLSEDGKQSDVIVIVGYSNLRLQWHISDGFILLQNLN